MLKTISSVVSKIKQVTTPVLLGRWCTSDKSKNKWKIDMANIDNCGTCLYSDLKKVNNIKNPNSDIVKGEQ